MDYNFSNIKNLGQSHCSLYYVLLQTGVFVKHRNFFFTSYVISIGIFNSILWKRERNWE